MNEAEERAYRQGYRDACNDMMERLQRQVGYMRQAAVDMEEPVKEYKYEDLEVANV